MIHITNQESMDRHFKMGALAQVCLTYLTKEYKEIYESLHQDDDKPFSLLEQGYRMLFVQSEDSCILTDSNVILNLLDTEPEYVELVELPEAVCMYRACLMPDNECFLLIYALRGALRPELEQWFGEQSGCLAKEDTE